MLKLYTNHYAHGRRLMIGEHLNAIGIIRD